ncbi:hypothetical protein OPT61_g9678 [Boeremia exigua]|uniref:Uncharacterized protein n=1 Tax=Boeremia exigua TaxID=749465 RepID=A0ACC2HT84_9PLEO|nr:hypothetical protein OPT61_g9678 [Boeremia exigua]
MAMVVRGPCECGRGGDVGPGEAAACDCIARSPNCPARNGGLFDLTVALLPGPRTLSRCLLEKVELRRLAAARQNDSSRGPYAAQDRGLRGITPQSANINHPADSGHQGRFGHEFLEFDFRVLGDGRSASARYANNSNYRNDSLIRKEMCVSDALVAEIKRIVKESEILKEDDTKWPQKNKDGRQELEIRLGSEHISFETAKIGSLQDVQDSSDPEGLRVFYYLVQDLKALVFSLIALHFKIKPI